MRTAGHYELFEILGEGGYGAVHKARDTRLNRTVAINVWGRFKPTYTTSWDLLGIALSATHDRGPGSRQLAAVRSDFSLWRWGDFILLRGHAECRSRLLRQAGIAKARAGLERESEDQHAVNSDRDAPKSGRCRSNPKPGGHQPKASHSRRKSPSRHGALCLGQGPGVRDLPGEQAV